MFHVSLLYVPFVLHVTLQLLILEIWDHWWISLLPRRRPSRCQYHCRCSRLLPAFLATLALLLSAIANFWCYSVQLRPAALDSVATLRFGLFSQSQLSSVEVSISDAEITTEQKCTAYSDSADFDGFWKAARAFAIIGFIIGAAITFALWLVPCFPQRYNDSVWKCLTAIFLLLVPVCQGLTFLMMKSDMCQEYPRTWLYGEHCQLGAGGFINIASIITWFLAGIIMAVFGSPAWWGGACLDPDYDAWLQMKYTYIQKNQYTNKIHCR